MGFECCLNCPSTVRKAGCHSYCELYIKARQELDEVNKRKREEQLKNSIIHQVGRPWQSKYARSNPKGRKEFF